MAAVSGAGVPLPTAELADAGIDWSGHRVLVTGGVGFIGSNLVRRLDALGAEVLVIDCLLPNYGGHRLNLAGVSSRVRIEPVDVRDEQAIPACVTGRQTIFNLAGQTSHMDSMSDPLTDLAINAQAQLHLLEACRRHAPDAGLVFASTRQIYGAPQRLPVDETHPLNPVDVNGINKLAGEGYHLLYHRVHGLRACALRLTNTYGPRMRIRDERQTFLGVWIRDVLRGVPFEVWGGAQLRDFTFVDDAVDAFLLAAAPSVAGRAYNIGGTQRLSLQALADTLIAAHGSGRYVVRPFPEARKRIDIGDYHADDTLFRATTGWSPRVGLREGLGRTLDYFGRHLDDYA
jgi:UDP-glucose 4-epimerase